MLLYSKSTIADNYYFHHVVFVDEALTVNSEHHVLVLQMNMYPVCVLGVLTRGCLDLYRTTAFNSSQIT